MAEEGLSQDDHGQTITPSNVFVDQDEHKQCMARGSDFLFDYSCEMCPEDGLNAEAVGYCTVCREYLCDVCIRAHKRSRPSRDHAMLDQSSIPKKKDFNKHRKTIRGRKNTVIPIEVKTGFLETEKADALVCSMRPDLNLTKAGASAALVRTAGYELQEQLDTKYRPPHQLDYGEIAVVNGHMLHCKYVLLGVMMKYDEKYDTGKAGPTAYLRWTVHDFMMRCLEKADELGLRSLTFPAVGCGNLMFPVDIVAEEMFHAVTDYQMICPASGINRVSFVIYHGDKEGFQAFKDEQRKFKKVSKPKHRNRERSSYPESLSHTLVGADVLKDTSGSTNDAVDNPYAKSLNEDDMSKGSSLTSLRDDIGDLPKRRGEKHSLDQSAADSIISSTKPQGLLTSTSRDDRRKSSKSTRARQSSNNIYGTSDNRSPASQSPRTRLSHNSTTAESITRTKPDRSLKFHEDSNGLSAELLWLSGSPRNGVHGDSFTKYGTHGDWDDSQMHSMPASLSRVPASGNIIHIPDRYSEDQLSTNFDISGVKVVVYYGDLTKEETEAIVNPANVDLDHSGSVAGALARARGFEMQAESNNYIRKNGRLKVTDVVHTSGGGEIKATHIMHAAGPIWFEYRRNICKRQIAETFLNCFKYANRMLWIRSIAVPAISTGVYGAPLEDCVRAFLHAILMFAHITQREGLRLREVRLVNNDAEATVTSIVLLQTLLEEGIDSLTRQALAVFQIHEDETAVEQDYSLHLSKGRLEDTDKYERDTYGYRPESARSGINSPLDHRNGSVNARGRDRSSTSSFSSPVTSSRDRDVRGASGTSSKTSSKTPIASTRSSRAAPVIKPAARPKTSRDTYERITRSEFQTARYNRHYVNDDDEDSDVGLCRLPIDICAAGRSSYRERFLQLNQAESKKNKADICAICLDVCKQPKQLQKCQHTFCTDCIRKHFRTKPTCPVCYTVYGEIHGDQPRSGMMTYTIKLDTLLPGYESEDGAIVVTYTFPDGQQEACHPSPGRSYKGLSRKCYLPNSVEGREILRMLKKAFDQRLVFTIGQSRTTGAYGALTWNDIHHKTSVSGGPTKHGYPDPGFMKRVKEDLAAKGITSDR